MFRVQTTRIDQIMRQNEQDWCEVTNRLQEEQLTDAHWKLLGSLNTAPEGSLLLCSIRKMLKHVMLMRLTSFQSENMRQSPQIKSKPITDRTARIVRLIEPMRADGTP